MVLRVDGVLAAEDGAREEAALDVVPDRPRRDVGCARQLIELVARIHDVVLYNATPRLSSRH